MIEAISPIGYFQQYSSNDIAASPASRESNGTQPPSQQQIAAQPEDKSASNSVVKSQNELTDEETRIVQELKQRDAEVKAHEQAHIAAGGPYVQSSASFEYQKGPDGKNYAVGGEVNIDTSPVRDDPPATIQKMQVVRRAALAPADPSPQDRSVAAQASQQEAQARSEMLREATEKDDDEANSIEPDLNKLGRSDTQEDQPTLFNAKNGISSYTQFSPDKQPNSNFGIYA